MSDDNKCLCNCQEQLCELEEKHLNAVGHFKTEILKLQHDLAELTAQCKDTACHCSDEKKEESQPITTQPVVATIKARSKKTKRRR